jgi:hypothetical protein
MSEGIPYRRMTVSEFIRESKEDWDHVAFREQRTSTGSFSGPLQVQVTGPTSRSSLVPLESFEEQAELQLRQIRGEDESMALWDEETVIVEDDDDVAQEAPRDDSRVVRGQGDPASRLPGPPPQRRSR